MSTLAQLVDEVEAELKDTSNAIWLSTEIEDHIAKALRDYSLRKPQQLDKTLTLSTTAREQAHAITDLLYITDVWYPYDTASETWPPPRPRWFCPNDTKLFLDVATAPSVGQKVRIFYAAPHVIQGLESGAATTLDKQGETLIILGASAYAAMQECQHVIGSVTVNDRTQEQYMQWAKMRFQMFQDALDRLEARRFTPANGGPAIQPPTSSPRSSL